MHQDSLILSCFLNSFFYSSTCGHAMKYEGRTVLTMCLCIIIIDYSVYHAGSKMTEDPPNLRWCRWGKRCSSRSGQHSILHSTVNNLSLDCKISFIASSASVQFFHFFTFSPRPHNCKHYKLSVKTLHSCQLFCQPCYFLTILIELTALHT